MNDRAFKAILVLLALFLLLCGLQSMEWRPVNDSPPMLYMAFLIDHFDYVPYLDFFEFQMPGTHLFFLGLTKVFGFGETAFRAADLLFLALLLMTTFSWMRKLDGRAAMLGSIAFGLSYLRLGPMMSMQREYIILLPLALAIRASLSDGRMKPLSRGALTGFLFGLAACVKPHSAIGLPLLVCYQAFGTGKGECEVGLLSGRTVGIAAAAFIGFSLPLGIMVLALWRLGSLDGFLDVLVHYVLLFAPMTGEHVLVGGFERVKYLYKGYLYLGGYGLLLVPATLGVMTLLARGDSTSALKRKIALLCGLAAVYSLYPVLPGKFWGYHWLPFSYFLILTASLCIVPLPAGSGRLRAVLPAVLLILTLLPFVGVQKELLCRAVGVESRFPQVERADEIAGFLEGRMQPGDAVQPLDVVGGTMHALLMTGARPATPFLYDFMFYHHTSNPYIRDLRARFVGAFEAAAPRFVVEVYDDAKPWPAGPGTTREFPALERILNADYAVVQKGDGYRIHERRKEPGHRSKEPSPSHQGIESPLFE